MKQEGFTLMELLIVTAIIAVIAIAVIVLMNPWQQINKARDAQRKHDLNVLQKAFEDYYNDKGCYPQAEHVCYDNPTNVCAISKTVTSKLCHICGKETDPPKFAEFSPYVKELPCDPEHPRKDYLYEIERPGCTRNGAFACAENCSSPDYCPQWYRIYADFSTSVDFDSTVLGCQGGGCGSSKTNPPFGYDYGVTSHQVGLEKSDNFWCINKAEFRCNDCGTGYQQCESSGVCISNNKIYGTVHACCAANPGARGCESY